LQLEETILNDSTLNVCFAADELEEVLVAGAAAPGVEVVLDIELLIDGLTLPTT